MTVAIAVRPVAIHSSLVDPTAALATGVEPTPALMQWLLAQNPRVRFGMLSLSDDGEVGLSHSLVGDSITSEELQVVRPAFVDMAQRLRRSLGQRFGLSPRHALGRRPALPLRPAPREVWDLAAEAVPLDLTAHVDRRGRGMPSPSAGPWSLYGLLSRRPPASSAR
ncbi:MAG TPA: hypothetical protein VL691_06915 [Vicinamibacteria bacterium]|nr:hypothetical protein [Vicinamibacteria bacterium]